MSTIQPSPRGISQFKVFVIIFGVVVFIALAIGIPVVASIIAENNYVKDNGVSAVGTPTGNIVDTHRGFGKNNRGADWRVEYEFYVDDERYTALGSNSENVKSLAQKRADYTDEVTVIYLPEDPSRYYVSDFNHIF